jgi:hypothetical protein
MPMGHPSALGNGVTQSFENDRGNRILLVYGLFQARFSVC